MDVNMSNLICENDIVKELEQFNIKLEDKELLVKLKNICLIYDFTAERLISEWLGYCSKRTWSTDVDAAKIELFENESFRQEKLKLEEQSKETEILKVQTQIQIDADMLDDYGITTTDNDINQINNKSNENVKTNGQITHVTTVSNEIQTSSQTNEKSTSELSNTTNGQSTNETNTNVMKVNDCVLENKMNESVELNDGLNQIMNYFGEEISPLQWINKDKTKFEIKPLNSQLHLTKAFKTGQIKIHEANEIMNELIDEMLELFMSRTKEELQLGESLFVGRINQGYATDDGQQKVLLLENPRLFQRRLKLDLSQIATYSLFPGKIVCFEGEIQSESNNLIVKHFFDTLLLPSFSELPIKLSNTPIYIMAASGPISPSMSDDLSSLEYLLEQVKIFQPHYLILLGPFFDCRNDYLLFNCDGENFFNKIMKMISSSLENIITEAIIVPSTFDLNNYNIYPAPPFEHSFPKIQFHPNPSFINLNGIIIALTTVDSIRHIIKEETKSINNNELDRICEHLLIQKNLYPLYPPNTDVNLEFSKLDIIKFNVRPHLFILPSMVRNFVKNVHGSLFVNPEYLSKNVFTKIRINSPPDNYTGSLEEYTRIEIVKNKPIR